MNFFKTYFVFDEDEATTEEAASIAFTISSILKLKNAPS